MSPLRRAGMYLSLALISTAHAARYFLATQRGEKMEGVRLIIVDGRRVLLVRHWYAPWAWTLPGGGVKRGETTEAAAIREAREETGLIVRSLEERSDVFPGDIVHVFSTGDFEGSLAMRRTFEIMSRAWFSIDDLPEELLPVHRSFIEAHR